MLELDHQLISSLSALHMPEAVDVLYFFFFQLGFNTSKAQVIDRAFACTIFDH